MTVIDYKKDTGEFHIHVFDKLSKHHIDFLQQFIPKNEKSNYITIDMNDLFKDDDSDSFKNFQGIHKTYFELTDWNFLESRYDHSTEKSVVQLTSMGKKIIEKF